MRPVAPASTAPQRRKSPELHVQNLPGSAQPTEAARNRAGQAVREVTAKVRTGVIKCCHTGRGPGFALVSRAAEEMQRRQYTRTGHGYSRKRPPTAGAMRTLELVPNAKPAPAPAPEHDNSLNPCRKHVSGTSSEAARNVSRTAVRRTCHGAPTVCWGRRRPAEAPQSATANLCRPVERWVAGDVSHLERGWPGCLRRVVLRTCVQMERLQCVQRGVRCQQQGLQGLPSYTLATSPPISADEGSQSPPGGCPCSTALYDHNRMFDGTIHIATLILNAGGSHTRSGQHSLWAPLATLAARPLAATLPRGDPTAPAAQAMSSPRLSLLTGRHGGRSG